MNRTRLSVATALAAALIASPATAYADCGEPGQDPCTGPVPTVDQVAAAMAQLTDPAANKNNVVTPGFSPEETQTVNDHLNQMTAKGLLPYNFVVTDIQPSPDNFAGATVTVTGSFNQASAPQPMVLNDRGGHWLITHDTAMTALDNFWYNTNRERKFCGFVIAFPIRCHHQDPSGDAPPPPDAPAPAAP
jgi:hypothetical protein